MDKSRIIAVKILLKFDESSTHIDTISHNEMQHTNLSDREKRLINELIHGALRWRGQLNWIAASFYQGNYDKCLSVIKIILQISLYQLIHLTKIPAYAAINEGVTLAKTYTDAHWANKVNGILRNFLRNKGQLNFPDLDINPVAHISVRYSHPQWMIKRWIDRLGINKTIHLCRANNSIPNISVRINHTKIKKEEFKSLLKSEKIIFHESAYLDEFVITQKLGNIETNQQFQQGLFSIQDESAGFVAHLMDPQPNDIILDLCAAPGGKSTHLAELSQNKNEIIANDIYLNRLNLIRENITRLKLQHIQLIQADAKNLICKKINKILVDAPCSGLGVLSRRSDLRWKRTPEQIYEVAKLQYQILQHASSLLTKNGVLVYSTCTIEPEENEQLITNFLQKHPQFKIDNPTNYVDNRVVTDDKYIYTYPHIHKMDGSFAIRLIKQSD